MKRLKPVALAVLAWTAFSTACGSLAADRLPSGPNYKDVTIATVSDAGKPFALRTNIYLPKSGTAGPAPLVLFIHGNGGAYNFANGSRSYELSIALTERGIAVATIDYRPQDTLPGELHDVKAYVRWFRAKARDYNIDPNRIAVWGTSRGGHLAAMLATTGDVKELEGDVGGQLEQSSRIQAAVIYYPLVDFLNAGADLMKRFPERVRNENGGGLTLQLLGYSGPGGMASLRQSAERNDQTDPNWKYVALAQQHNPLQYVSKDDPPIVLAHSSIDPVVAVDQSLRLYERYLANGLDASLLLWSKGNHGSVGADIETTTADWIAKKLLVEMAPKK